MYNDTHQNDTQHNDTQHNDTQLTDTQHNDIKKHDSQHKRHLAQFRSLYWVTHFLLLCLLSLF